MSAHREIRLVEEETGQWSAIDEETGVASVGETREQALHNLDEALALHNEPIEDAEDLATPDAPWF